MTNVTKNLSDHDIVCDNLVRIYQAEGIEVVALQGLDLVVEPGELLAVVGASGSGKSTLLNILSGNDVPTAGSAVVAGHDLLDISGGDRAAYRRDVAGFVWQQTADGLMPFLTAAENIALPLLISKTSRSARSSRVDELLDLLGIADCQDRRPAEMSGGEQQRCAIAVAVANQPRVLFADEPTGELDSATAVEMFDALRRTNDELGTTVVIVTHDPGVADHVDRTVAIRDGRTSSEVLRRTELTAEGHERIVAEEYAVLDRAGRVQIPREFLTQLGLRDRVRLELEPDHVGMWPSRPAEDSEHGGETR